MAQSRIISLKDEETYKALIKSHLSDPKHTTKHWRTGDLDVVVHHHVEFLRKVAMTGCKINETILQKCLKDMFASTGQECKEFAKKLAEALSYCRSKRKGLSTGAKLHASVLEVVNAINTFQNGAEDSPRSSPSPPAPSEEDFVSGEDLVEIDTPPRRKTGSDGLDALMELRKAFGEEDSNARASLGLINVDPDSPMSIASSASSPIPKMSTAASSSSWMPALPIQALM